MNRFKCHVEKYSFIKNNEFIRLIDLINPKQPKI